VRDLLLGERSSVTMGDERKKQGWLQAGDAITSEALDAIPRRKLRDVRVENAQKMQQIEELLAGAEEQATLIKTVFEEKINRLKKGDELPPGVFKMVKVYVAIKRKLSVGDKMAGRHGNKGVISRILPEEDMPYTADGEPVEIVLNPLGVPSRMNIGQILETHLGWAARGLGDQIQKTIERGFGPEPLRKMLRDVFDTPSMRARIDRLKDDEVWQLTRMMRKGVHVAASVFDGPSEREIKGMLDQAALPRSGQTVLYDGRSGEPFQANVTVGVMYLLKLHHLVDDKIHARSIGPYSLVTQQPLGGKAQFGGQRLGEMEVWAMEAYGAAYALQEFLTVKSDDVIGRTRMYESIVKGDCELLPGLPESFNVLTKEMQSLGLNIDLLEDIQ
jgi:DNA-directed RNA polymerase subunit beta